MGEYVLEDLFGSARQEMMGHVPHCRLLGMKLVEAGPCTGTVSLPWQERLVGDPSRGVVFGGVITTLLDHACGLAVMCSLKEAVGIATLDLRIDYLRAAVPGAELFARAECYKSTGSVAFVRGAAWDTDSGDPFATSLATFMLGAHTAGHGSLRAAVGSKEQEDKQ